VSVVMRNIVLLTENANVVLRSWN